jgi:hypothetical protein
LPEIKGNPAFARQAPELDAETARQPAGRLRLRTAAPRQKGDRNFFIGHSLHRGEACQLEHVTGDAGGVVAIKKSLELCENAKFY